jgi:NAD(P)-dependent dehydrogenase (short-subunit alcohol dehydrogenase family)
MAERVPRLEGKVAIVTGAGASGEIMGNGKATAILFAREGAKVLLVDNEEDRAVQTLETITAEGGEASVFTADVSRADDCEAMVQATVQRYGRLDILHNNVGIGGSGTVLEVSEEDWDRVMTVNVKSMMLTSKFAIPQMVSSGGGGSIVNISSISAVRPRGLTAYSVSKGGVIALTQAMAMDHAANGIRVNCIMPGPVYTSMVARNMTEERRVARREASPLGVEGSGWDIGYAGLFLASDEARWITGVILPVDGGVTLASPSR